MTPHEAVLQDDALALSEFGKGHPALSSTNPSSFTPLQRACEQLDEALRIHRDEELPVLERLGDVR